MAIIFWQLLTKLNYKKGRHLQLYISQLNTKRRNHRILKRRNLKYFIVRCTRISPWWQRISLLEPSCISLSWINKVYNSYTSCRYQRQALKATQVAVYLCTGICRTAPPLLPPLGPAVWPWLLSTVSLGEQCTRSYPHDWNNQNHLP